MWAEKPGWLHNWLLRHQTRASFVLHAVGIPLTIIAIILAGVQLYHSQWPLWWRPAGLLALGYALQWLGHRIEGNDMGEVILVKRMLGKPYVAIAPQLRSGDADSPEPRPSGRGRASSPEPRPSGRGTV